MSKRGFFHDFSLSVNGKRHDCFDYLLFFMGNAGIFEDYLHEGKIPPIPLYNKCPSHRDAPDACSGGVFMSII
jgi:hypothetical protein